MVWRQRAREVSTLREFVVRPYALCRMRASVPTQSVGSLCRLISSEQEPWQIRAHAGNGIVHIQSNADQKKERFIELLTVVQKFATEQGGNVVVEECPSEWKAGLPIWGAPRNDYWLMHRIKESLDPDNIFNPGRFVDGI